LVVAVSQDVQIVIPCFNEEHRLDEAAFAPLFDSPDVALLFVDDGSTDGTSRVVEKMLAEPNRPAALYRLGRNSGKAEAVRAGLLEGLERGFRYVGYADADMSTPAGEIVRLVRLVKDEDLKLAMGARVLMMGTRIDRRTARHFAGRVFATVASLGLGVPVYDTQCGAKVIASCPALREALADPFGNRWAFDVELIGRLLYPEDPAIEPIAPSEIKELPLETWEDVAGSKLKPDAMVVAGLELLRVAWEVRRRKRGR
jgi:glycosyltransferase involved in cell wall biosynthesis